MRVPVSYTHLLENRTIVSGIAQHYKPEELVGKQVLFIANLAPRPVSYTHLIILSSFLDDYD